MVIRKLAPAKINLTLEVLAKREDGWHDISSIMQTIDLCDTLIIHESSRIEIITDYSLLPPWDSMVTLTGNSHKEDNLVYKAAKILQDETGYRGGADIKLIKRIPSASGLGGGSSDAAAALRGLNELWKLGLGTSELVNIGTKLGSDVAFFIYGGTCLVEGRGERVTPLKALPRRWMVLLLPSLAIPEKTKTLYSCLRPEYYTPGSFTRALRETLDNGKAIQPGCYYNVFSRVYPKLFPEFEKYFQQLQEAGARFPQVAGSGPAIYCFVRNRKQAEEVARRLKKMGRHVYSTGTFDGKPLGSRRREQ
jgi:4-diphosphocytidyl-2-C-methyl-D-erythritol kinase